MKMVLIAVMVIAGIGMVVGLVKQKAGESWGKPLATLCALLVVLCAVGQMFMKGGAGSSKAVVDTEMRYLEVSAQKLGDYLAQTCPGAKALVVTDPPTAFNEGRRKAMSEGLKKGFAGKVTVAAEDSPTIPEEAKKAAVSSSGPDGGADPNAVPPMEYWLTAKLFDELVAKHASTCDLVVSMVGLPTDMAKMKLWTQPTRPKVALASGSVYDLRKVIAGKGVVAAVAYNPKAVYDNNPPPADMNQAFDKRFLLVTPENVETMATQYEGLLQ